MLAVALSADEIEHGQPVTVGANRFPIDQEPPAGQRRDGFDDERKARCEIVAVAGYQVDTGLVAPGENAHPVVLDLVEPLITGRRAFGRRWQAGSKANTQHAPV